MEQRIIKSTTLAIDDILKLALIGDSKMWIDYDKEADVLYVNFGRPQKADNAYQDKDSVIRRMKKNKIIGLTILHASRFAS